MKGKNTMLKKIWKIKRIKRVVKKIKKMINRKKGTDRFGPQQILGKITTPENGWRAASVLLFILALVCLKKSRA